MSSSDWIQAAAVNQVDGGAIMRSVVLNNQVLLGTVNAGRDAYEAAVADLALSTISEAREAQERSRKTAGE